MVWNTLKFKHLNLLGSTVDREASQKEREKDQPTFKDNDFLKDGVKIHIGEEAKAKLMETLKGLFTYFVLDLNFKFEFIRPIIGQI